MEFSENQELQEANFKKKVFNFAKRKEDVNDELEKMKEQNPRIDEYLKDEDIQKFAKIVGSDKYTRYQYLLKKHKMNEEMEVPQSNEKLNETNKIKFVYKGPVTNDGQHHSNIERYVHAASKDQALKIIRDKYGKETKQGSNLWLDAKHLTQIKDGKETSKAEIKTNIPDEKTYIYKRDGRTFVKPDDPHAEHPELDSDDDRN